jgi:KDO2-lipid IV(A) lauroyltransferase
VIGAVLGVVAYWLGIRRRVALDNLARAFPTLNARERRRLARAAYAQLGRSLVELWQVRRMSDVELERRVRFEGWDRYLRARAAGRGVVFAVAHFGNWELLARALR